MVSTHIHQHLDTTIAQSTLYLLKLSISSTQFTQKVEFYALHRCCFNMKKVLFLIPLLISILSAKDMIVVTSTTSGIQNISQKQIKEIFLKKRNFIGEAEVIAINLSASEPTRIDFEEKILNMDRTELAAYWAGQHYQGISPPVTQKSQISLKAFLKNVKGAIGYMEKSQLEPGLKVLHVF